MQRSFESMSAPRRATIIQRENNVTLLRHELVPQEIGSAPAVADNLSVRPAIGVSEHRVFLLWIKIRRLDDRSEEHTSELQSPMYLLFPYTTLFRSQRCFESMSAPRRATIIQRENNVTLLRHELVPQEIGSAPAVADNLSVRPAIGVSEHRVFLLWIKIRRLDD